LQRVVVFLGLVLCCVGCVVLWSFTGHALAGEGVVVSAPFEYLTSTASFVEKRSATYEDYFKCNKKCHDEEHSDVRVSALMQPNYNNGLPGNLKDPDASGAGVVNGTDLTTTRYLCLQGKSGSWQCQKPKGA